MALQNFLSLAALVAAICNLALTVFIFRRDFHATVNRVFVCWGLAVTLWNLGTFFLFHVAEKNLVQARFWVQVLQLGVICLPIFNIHLCLLVAQVSIGRWLPFLYCVHAGLVLSLLTGQFIAEDPAYIHYLGAWYGVPRPGFYVFLAVYSFCTIYALCMMYFRQKALPPLLRARVRWMMTAIGILAFFGSNDLLPILGMKTYPFTHLRVYTVGNFAAILYVIMFSYSVLQFQLLDIHVTMGRLAAQMVRLLFICVLGLILLLIVATLAPGFTPVSFFSALGVLVASAAIASILFPRFFGSGDEALERRILGDRFEYHDKIQGFIRMIPWYSETSSLLQDFQDLLINTINVRSYQMILVDESSRAFSLLGSYPERPAIQLPKIHRDSPVFDVFRYSKQDYLTFNSLYVTRESELERAAKQELTEFDPEFCFRFMSDDDPFGLLLIGPKVSGEPYTPHDLHLLTLLVKNLGSVMNQIRLKNQVLQAEELELLGRMSRGMAHDLNNLLTPVSTYLQLSHGPSNVRQSAEELLPTAMRNMETMHAYIKEALFFSRHHTLQIEERRLDQLVHTCVDLADQKLKRKKMEIVVASLPEVEIEMDSVLIQRLVGNIISNGIDASPVGSKIRIELYQLAKTETNRDWWRLMIIDEGEGISKANLRRIMNPYFTTKDQGDKDRGFGLGLAICRKIIHLHGGNLNIASEEKKGTTVQVDLPSRQVKSNQTPNLNLATAIHS